MKEQFNFNQINKIHDLDGNKERDAEKNKDFSDLAFGKLTFEPSPELASLLVQLTKLKNDILSDKEVDKGRLEDIKEDLSKVYQEQGERLKKEVWELYNSKLPKDMSFANLPENYKEMKVLEGLERHTGSVLVL